MPITLITGPANAGKAKAVLDAVARHVSRGEQPVLVVPTGADADRYRQELAREGPVAGVSVSVFAGLLERVARCAAADEQELARPPLSALAREQVLCALAAKMQSSPGGPRRLARALSGAIAELQAAEVSPAQLRASLGAGSEGQIELRARMLVELHERYSAVLARSGVLDAELRARRALDVLRRRPSLWRVGAGQRPVLLYGFDDLTSLEMDAVETIGIAVDAHVTVALAYEAGRVAFAGRAWAFQELAPRAAEHVALGPRRDYYAAGSRAALHHLERRLFEEQDDGGEASALGGAATLLDGASTALGGGATSLDGSAAANGAATAAPAGQQLSLTEPCEQSDGGESEHGPDIQATECIRLLPAGSPQEEAALIAEQARALIQDGISPHEIAIVHRVPAGVADHLAQALDAAGVPHGIASRARFADSALGRALTGLLSCGCEGIEGCAAASLADLLAWLRAPGLLEREHLADGLEARARQAGVRDAAGARRIWERDGWKLDAIDRVRDAAGRGAASLLECARRELMRLFTAPRAGAAEVLDLRRQEAALAVQAGIRAIAELRELAALDAALLGGAEGVLDALASIELPRPNVSPEAGVALLDPLALRARRVRVLFACGLQEGVFPAASRTDPILSEEMRARLASICGPRVGRRQDLLAAERYLLYATVSRPEERLYLSWHEAGQGGAASAPSLFLDDVCDLFGPHLRAPRPDREPEHAAGAQGHHGARAAAATGVSDTADGWTQRLMPEMRERELWSASSLERWSACPASWFIERLLRAQDIEPEPEPLARGSLAHLVLGDVFEGLREQTGSARLTAAGLQTARALMAKALERRAAEVPLTVAQERLPLARRRLEVDLDRYLLHAAEQSSPLEPTHIELAFGFPEEPGSLPPLKLADGVLLRGRIDRVDVGAGGQAVVYDYKSGRTGSGHSGVKWLQSGLMQMALYMRVVSELLGLEVVGGLYQPLSGGDLRARGLLAGDADLQISHVRTDRCDREQIEEIVGEVCESAVQAARQAQAGAIEARPGTCSYAGGCMYPTICRCRC
jgi:inactivated superfamily I helicase